MKVLFVTQEISRGLVDCLQDKFDWGGSLSRREVFCEYYLKRVLLLRML